MPSFSCPSCGATMSSAQPIPAGKKVKCRACETVFDPAAVAVPRPGQAMPAKKAAAAKAAAPKPVVPPVEVDDDAKPFAVLKEEDTAEMIEAKKRVNFAGTAAKYKKSARGPAMSLLIMPSNLLIAEGVLTFIGGILIFLRFMWPLLFTEIEASDEEIAENIPFMLLGIMVVGWGTLICWGASKMQNVESYTWAMVGAVLGLAPLLVGIFAIIMLRNPKVIAGFEEIEGSAEEGDDKDDEDDDEDDDDDD